MLPSSFRKLYLRAAPQGLRSRWVRIVLLLLAIGYFFAAVGFLVLRYAVLPRVDRYRPEIEQALSRSIGLPVGIEQLAADWDGLRPRLRIKGLRLRDAQGRDALRLGHVDASVGWSSLYFGRLRLHTLVLDQPALDVRRTPDGQVFVAGIAVRGEGGRSSVMDWVLAQRVVVIENARLTWTDMPRGAPTLLLDHVRLRLENRGGRHRLGVTADARTAGASGFDLRADFRGVPDRALRQGSGEVYCSLDQANLAIWQKWIDYPFQLQRGQGGVRMWLNFRDGQLAGASAEVAVRDARLRFSPQLPILDLARVSGRIAFHRSDALWRVTGSHLALATANGVEVLPTDFKFERKHAQGNRPAEGAFSASRFDLAALAGLAEHLPFPAAWRERLVASRPLGKVERLELGWQDAGARQPLAYHVDARVVGIGTQAVAPFPGVSGLSGTFKADERGGVFDARIDNGSIKLPAVFENPDVALATATFKGDWKIAGGLATVRLQAAKFRNADLDGHATGTYRMRADGPGEIDLSAGLGRAEGRSVWRYMPLVVHENARNWLKRSLKSGAAEDLQLVLRGNLAHFPFSDDPAGVFHITYRVRDVFMDYAPRWPAMEGVNGNMVFDRARMEISADEGRILGTHVQRVQALVPDLDHAELTVDGEVSGPTSEFLRFVNASPLTRSVGHLTGGLQVQGMGVLALHLQMPLNDVSTTAVRGEYRFAHNNLKLLPFLPVLQDAGGRFGFTERSFSIPDIAGQFLGAATRMHGDTRPDGTVDIEARANVPVRALSGVYDVPFSGHLSGEIPVTAKVSMKGREVFLGIESSLVGLSSSLPEPFNKSATALLPFKLDWRWVPEGETLGQTLTAALGASVRARLQMRDEHDATHLQRGVIALGSADGVTLPEKGLALRADLPSLDLDAWRRILGNGNGKAGVVPDTVSLQVGDLRAFGYRFHGQGVRVEHAEGRWDVHLTGAQAAGDIRWDAQGAGALRVRLKRLALATAATSAERPLAAAGVEEVPPAKVLPVLDVMVDALTESGHELGALALRGAPEAGGNWRLDRFALENPDGVLQAQGDYQAGSANRTQMGFTLDAPDAGAMLARLGYPGAVRRGATKITGSLVWPGTPDRFAMTRLSGAFKLDAGAGQFVKLNPGMGRLLGVLNLQALPRRITLDFRDVFSEGFAFDAISGSMKINRGTVQTDDLSIAGPAAKVFMTGSVDLAAETQSLRVRVQPTLSDTVAIGVALGPLVGAMNPAAGLVTYLAQKLMRDPIEKLFTYEYEVVGNWDDPKVRKLPLNPSATPPLER